jgi:hypothetical protein
MLNSVLQFILPDLLPYKCSSIQVLAILITNFSFILNETEITLKPNAKFCFAFHFARLATIEIRFHPSLNDTNYKL